MSPKSAATSYAEWTGWEIQDLSPEVRTEAPSGHGRYIDVEVTFDQDPSYRLWIEIKRDLMGEGSPDQISSYVADLANRCRQNDRTGHVVYLTRPGVPDPAPDTPPGIGYRATNWRQVGEFLKKNRSNLGDDFLSYLEEESLYMQPLTDADLDLLNRGAHERAAALIDEADSQIQSRCDDLGLHEWSGPVPKPKNWIMRWGDWNYSNVHLPSDIPASRHLILEWNLRRRGGGQHTGSVVFAAGLTWMDTSEDAWSLFPDLVDAMTDLRNPFDSYGDDLHRLYRWLDPAELVDSGLEFDQQVGRLANFVHSAYQDALEILRQTRYVPPTREADEERRRDRPPHTESTVLRGSLTKAEASDQFVAEVFERALTRIEATDNQGGDVRERTHLDPEVKRVLADDLHIDASSRTLRTKDFSGLGPVDVVVPTPPVLIELKWSYDENRSKIFESVWDAIKLSILAVDIGSLGYIATGASYSAWNDCECQDLFDEGRIDPQEIWRRPLVPPGPNSGATIGEDLIRGSGSRGRPFACACQLEITPIARLPYPGDYELRIARIEGVGPLTTWPEHLPGVDA